MRQGKTCPLFCIEIDLRQAVDQRLAAFHDHALEPIPPEIPPAAVTLVVKSGKIDFDFTHELGKAGQLLPNKRQLPVPCRAFFSP